jgi:predicted HicB family RNase H-like nuclease
MTSEGGDVPKKKSESRRYNMLVRLDDEVVEMGKKVAALRGVSLAEFFSDILRPAVDREFGKEVAKLTRDDKGGKGPIPRHR